MIDEQLAQGQTAAPEAKQEIIARTWTDAPASANVKATIGGHDWQLTFRADTFAQLSERIPVINEWLDKHSSRKQNGHMQPTSAQVAPAVMAFAPPSPPLQIPQAQTGSQGQAACQMIEVVLSFKTQKPQLKFHCNGFDKPLTVTQSLEDMAKLVAPLGLTQAHIVVGQKYTIPALVNWSPSSDGKYKNVISVMATS